MFIWNLRSCTQLSSLIVAVCATSYSVKFSKVKGQRVTSGATQTGTLTRAGMTTMMCASFCGNVCGMFQHNSVTNECRIFSEKSYDSGVVLISDPDWAVSYRQRHVTVVQDDWTMVFRAQAGIGVYVWDTWNSTGVNNDNPIPDDFPFACLRLTDYSSCDRHFRSHLLDNWAGIKEVRFSFIKADNEVAFILFNGTDTSRDSWFSQDRILDSSWSPHLRNEVRLTTPGIFGNSFAPNAVRRFYFFGPQNGCEYDWVYTMAGDYPTDTCIYHGLWHVPFGTLPNFYYSPTSTGRASFRTDGAYPLAEKADVLAVWVKFA